jgi:hypothetical protein
LVISLLIVTGVTTDSGRLVTFDGPGPSGRLDKDS